MSILALLVLTFSCSRSSDGGGGDEGVTVDPGELPSRHLVERFRLGGAADHGNEAFTRVPPLAVAADGSLFALATALGEVRRFGPGGRFLGSIGGRGEGPGEFSNPGLLGLVGDTLWVRDLSPPRLSYFTPDGGHLRTAGLEGAPIARGGLPIGPEAVLRGGTWIMPGPVPSGAPPGPTEAPLLLLRRGGELRDTVASVIRPDGLYVPEFGMFWRIRPFPRPPLYDAMPGGEGVVVADWERGRNGGIPVTLTVHGWNGGTTLERMFVFPLVPLEGSVADSMVAAAADSVRAAVARTRAAVGAFRGLELPGDLPGVVREQLALEDHLPPIADVVAGVDGSFWLQRVVGRGRSEWIALAPDGTPAFRVDLREGHTLRAASLKAVWATHTDELDVPYISRYDLADGAATGGVPGG